MNDMGYAVLVALIVGAGTAAGALITFFIKTTSKRLSAVLMGIAGGVMLATVLFDMIPESVEEAGWPTVIIGLLVGAAVMFLVTFLIPHQDASDVDEELIQNIKSKNLVRAGLLLAVGIAIHNLPQGIALGSGIASGFGVVLALLLLLHNVPEGMAMAIPLKIGGVSHRKILWIALVAAIPTVIGAIIGVAVANISPIFIGGSVAFAGGAMLYLSIRELIPQAMGMNNSASPVLAMIIGAAIGGAVVLIAG